MNILIICLCGIVAIVNSFPNKHDGFITSSYKDAEHENIKDSNLASSQDSPRGYINLNPNVDYKVQIPLRSIHTKTQLSYKRKNPEIQQVQYRRGEEAQTENKLEEKEEEPDRLSILLLQSKFNCNAKNTGYYADEDLGCEVFHYCQDNAKHSWICPEGFTFHQVHLICMPPGGDNICEKSSNYHFVNDFLYKPVNLEEHQTKPNVSLRYSDRYFPDTYTQNYNNDDNEPNLHQHSVRVAIEPRQQTVSSIYRPQTSIGQVFRSPEEINISLQQRRPQYSTTKYDSFK
ncbi:unnamed protein product [Brassicogethes aeneus]|uniref:Chitin-binding type-2 domain-containing protein n=1 Tax=Brassicogethes aeneus TaxID=1431903 RepID=A0A9P0AWH0_BRAAE|nr:unnamed protein product [Brassicogethes aeneus]